MNNNFSLEYLIRLSIIFSMNNSLYSKKFNTEKEASFSVLKNKQPITYSAYYAGLIKKLTNPVPGLHTYP